MNEEQARDAMNRKATVQARDFSVFVRGTIVEVSKEPDGSICASVARLGTGTVFYFNADDVQEV